MSSKRFLVITRNKPNRRNMIGRATLQALDTRSRIPPPITLCAPTF